MKKQMRFLIIAFITVAVIVTAGILLYRHFVTDRVKDKGGMEMDWQAEMIGQWTGVSEGYENYLVEITDQKAVLSDGTDTLYEGPYTVDETSGSFIPENTETVSRFEYSAPSLIAVAADGTEIRFEKK